MAADPSQPPATLRIVGQAAMKLLARLPWTWPLLRAPMRRFFDRLAPEWDRRTGAPDRMAPLEASLSHVGTEPAQALDLGTGTGAAAAWLVERYPEARVVGVDISERMIALARKRAGPEPGERLRFEVGDSSNLPFASDEFDLVVQVSAPPFFAEAARVLAPRGHLVVVSTLGAATPFHTPRRLLRAGFRRQGLREVAVGEAGSGSYWVARKSG